VWIVYTTVGKKNPQNCLYFGNEQVLGRGLWYLGIDIHTFEKDRQYFSAFRPFQVRKAFLAP
jgi:hypothetical protein